MIFDGECALTARTNDDRDNPAVTDQLLTLLVLLAAPTAVVLFTRPQNNSEWHPVTRYRTVRLIDGRECRDTRLWGRKVKGEWQYKQMTAEEYNLDLADRSF